MACIDGAWNTNVITRINISWSTIFGQDPQLVEFALEKKKIKKKKVHHVQGHFLVEIRIFFFFFVKQQPT